MKGDFFKKVKRFMNKAEYTIYKKGIFIFLFLFLYTIYVKFTDKSIDRFALSLLDGSIIYPLFLTLYFSLLFFLRKMNNKLNYSKSNVENISNELKKMNSEIKPFLGNFEIKNNINTTLKESKLLSSDTELLKMQKRNLLYLYNHKQISLNKDCFVNLASITVTLLISSIILFNIKDSLFEFSFIFSIALLSSFIIDLLVNLLRKSYLFFSFHIPDSKDRMTVIIAIFGTVISLIALFK